MVQNYYTNKITHEKNGMVTINLFKSFEAKQKFYNDVALKKTDLYTRSEIKELLRKYIDNDNNKKLFENAAIQICYVSDIGMYYVNNSIINNNNNLPDDIKNQLMADPTNNRGASGMGNVSVFSNDNAFFGIVIEILPLPKAKPVKEKKKIINKIKSVAPVLQMSTEPWD